MARWIPARGQLGLLALELALSALIVWGDVGFDKPGALGLDFGHLLLILAGLAVAWGAGLWLAVRRRDRGMLALQLALPVLVGVAALLAGN